MFFTFKLFVYQSLDDLIIILLDTFVKRKLSFFILFSLVYES
nr:MAG TPA: hypothetical protein [Bacteriophage sp.]